MKEVNAPYLSERPRQRPGPLGGVVEPTLVALLALPVRGELGTHGRVLVRTRVATWAEPLEELAADGGVRSDADVAERTLLVGARALQEVGADGHALRDDLRGTEGFRLSQSWASNILHHLSLIEQVGRRQ